MLRHGPLKSRSSSIRAIHADENKARFDSVSSDVNNCSMNPDRHVERSVLITGGDGQLATDLAVAFSRHGWRTHTPGHADLDVTDRQSVIRTVEALKPEAVINTAAWTNPQGCEDDQARAWATHAMAVRHLAEAVDRTGSHLCQISTDYVFDGTPGETHTEWDRPEPTSVYGHSKLGGEAEVLCGHTIVRTSRILSHNGNNVGRNVLRLATTNPDQQFRFDAHHKGCVTFATDLAETIHTLVAGRFPGIYHVTNSGAVTWFEFVQAVLTAAGLNESRVEPLPADAPIPGPPRPEYSVLENIALRSADVAPLTPWNDSLSRFVAESQRV